MLDLWHPELTSLEKEVFLKAMFGAVQAMGRTTALHSMNIYKPKEILNDPDRD